MTQLLRKCSAEIDGPTLWIIGLICLILIGAIIASS